MNALLGMDRYWKEVFQVSTVKECYKCSVYLTITNMNKFNLVLLKFQEKRLVALYKCDVCIYSAYHAVEIARHLRIVHSTPVVFAPTSGLKAQPSTGVVAETANINSQKAKPSEVQTFEEKRQTVEEKRRNVKKRQNFEEKRHTSDGESQLSPELVSKSSTQVRPPTSTQVKPQTKIQVKPQDQIKPQAQVKPQNSKDEFQTSTHVRSASTEFKPPASTQVKYSRIMRISRPETSTNQPELLAAVKHVTPEEIRQNSKLKRRTSSEAKSQKSKVRPRATDIPSDLQVGSQTVEIHPQTPEDQNEPQTEASSRTWIRCRDCDSFQVSVFHISSIIIK